MTISGSSLWSLFDFVQPGLLGNLFEREFSEPIKAGSYTNAGSFTVLRAYSCAVALRDLIRPFLLRRLKRDVNANLPGKTEQVFFVSLSEAQRQLYVEFLGSSTCRAILAGREDAFVGIDYLRKLCDHPRLCRESVYYALRHSSKLNLLRRVLPTWKSGGHRALLFSQYLECLGLLEELLGELGLDFFRIDGSTPAPRRQGVIDRFNAGERFACLLSTQVGGVGINLIGADRVVIVDPAWNPATDAQALERAFRIGQRRDVTVFRLVTVGTIEEKMYKKQIFKEFLANKILKNPHARDAFHRGTVRDLFELDNVSVADEPDEEASDPDAEDDDDPEQRLMRGLCEDGDLARVFDRDRAFGGKESGPEVEARRADAERQTDRARQALEEAGRGRERLQKKVLSFLRWRGGSATSEAVVARFRDDADVVKDGAGLKQVLRNVATLDKARHTWDLLEAFRAEEPPPPRLSSG